MITKTDPIGIRVLTKNMMDCTFNHTEEVLRNIEKIRRTAYAAHDDFRITLQKAPDQGIMEAHGYNNAISILGSRGAGKTSIIMTLQHILRYGEESWKKNIIEAAPKRDIDKNNILMPILVPQDFSQGQSLLSWVIMQLLQKGEEIERIITAEKMYLGGINGPFAKWDTHKTNCSAFDPLRKCMDDLTRSFELRYKRDAGYISANSDHVYEYMDEVRRDGRLILDMLRLISMIVDFYRFQQPKKSTENAADYEPLIFFVIDDMDLAPSHSQEVLTLVLRYLQHPNIVVLCGWNQELFQSHLCLDLLKTQGSLDSKLLDTNFGYDDVFMKRQRKRIAALDSARRLAIDNLKKAFPPALRYEIRGLSTLQRAWFPNAPIDKSKPDSSDCFIHVISDALRECRPDNNAPVEFLFNNDNAVLAYMRIFDNKARGMVNAYLAFQMLRQYISQWDKNSKFDITSQIKALIDTLLFSNTRFVPYRRGLRDLIRIDKVAISRQDAICEYFCNFQAVENVLKEYHLATDMADKNSSFDQLFYIERQYNYFPTIIIDTYILLNFVENMLMYICRKPYYEHGGLEFSKVLNKIIPPIRISPDPDNLLSCALALSGIDEIDLFPNSKDFRTNLLLLNAYEKHNISDENYDFSGIHSYRNLSCALTDVFGVNLENIKQNNRFSGLNRDWLSTIGRLFSALIHSHQNVRRLNIYRNLLYQNNPESAWDVIYLVDALANFSVNIKSWNRKELKERKILMSDLEDIAYVARYILSLIRKWKKTDRKDRDAELRHMKEMMLFDKSFTEYTEYSDKKLIDIQEYKEKIENFRRNLHSVLTTTEVDEKIKPLTEDMEYASFLVHSVSCANNNINMLIINLRLRLQHACYKTLSNKKTAYERFLYLLGVSKKIPAILEKLQLGTGVWSTKESKAAFTLMEILRQYNIEELYSDARQVFQLGPTLERTSRNIYNQCLQRISRWIKKEYRYFSQQDLLSIEEILDVLQEAYQKIQRDTEVEDKMQEVIKTFGHNVAILCANLSVHKEMPDGRGEHYQSEVVWPVENPDRDEFKQWKTQSYETDLFS